MRTMTDGLSLLLLAKARSLSLATVLRLSDTDEEAMLVALRWPDTAGKPVCPHCGCTKVYEACRLSTALRFRCKACRKDFSFTSGTLFAFHKLPLPHPRLRRIQLGGDLLALADQAR